MKPLSLALFGLTLLSCEGEDLRLGGAPPISLSFASVERLTLRSDADDDNPTLTGDELYLCFTSAREGGMGSRDIWCASRLDRQEEFLEATPVEELNTEEFESSSALSLDGLSLWFGSDREGGQGGLDIYESSRPSVTEPWSEPTLVSELNSEEDDIPRPPGQGGLVMPLASRRGGGDYQTYLAERESDQAPFLSPILLESIAQENAVIVDGFLSDDGLLLLFTIDPESDEEHGDLYFSVRDSVADQFSTSEPLEGVNTAAEERDPWLSPDGETLYFVSDRESDGDLDIYAARRVR